MKNIWNRLTPWLEVNAKHLLGELNKGATSADFAKLEQTIGAKLPSDFKDFYQVHNGQQEGYDGLIDGEELLSTGRIIDEWKVWKGLYDGGDFKDSCSSPDRGVKNDWWHPLWIPITYDGSGNHFCMDLSPATDGRVGQIIRLKHDDDKRKLVADSFAEWVTRYAEDIENGNYIYSEADGGVVNKDNFI